MYCGGGGVAMWCVNVRLSATTYIGGIRGEFQSIAPVSGNIS